MRYNAKTKKMCRKGGERLLTDDLIMMEEGKIKPDTYVIDIKSATNSSIPSSIPSSSIPSSSIPPPPRYSSLSSSSFETPNTKLIRKHKQEDAEIGPIIERLPSGVMLIDGRVIQNKYNPLSSNSNEINRPSDLAFGIRRKIRKTKSTRKTKKSRKSKKGKKTKKSRRK